MDVRAHTPYSVLYVLCDNKLMNKVLLCPYVEQ